MSKFTAIEISAPRDGLTMVSKVEVDGDSTDFIHASVGSSDIEHRSIEGVRLWLRKDAVLSEEPNTVANEVHYWMNPNARGQDLLSGNVAITGTKGSFIASVSRTLWRDLQALPWVKLGIAEGSIEFVEGSWP